MEQRKLICIECPRGCDLTATLDNGVITDVKGNFCAKGKTYAQNELTRPLRVVTSAICLKSGEMLPVKTDKGVLKTKIFDVMAKINKATASKPVKIGQVLKENIDREGANLIAAKNID